MTEQRVRDMIAKATNPTQKGVLKVVLGEYQQKNFLGKATEADLVKIAEKIVEGNKEMLTHFKEGDPRIQILTDENAIVVELIPKYLGIDDLMPLLPAEIQHQVNVANNDGAATGVISKWIKASGLAVKGETMKLAVTHIRSLK